VKRCQPPTRGVATPPVRSLAQRRLQIIGRLAVLCCVVFPALCAEASEAQAQALLPPPPPPRAPDPGAAQTVQQLDRAEREDSGRGLQFAWLTPEVGFGWASLGLLYNSDLLDDDLVPAQSFGPVLGAGAGLRLLYLTAGARFRYALLQDYHLWSLGVEGALRIPKGDFEPHVFIGAGFARVSSFEAEAEVHALGTRAKALALDGLNARLGGGFDYFVTPVFSVGARAEVEFTFLSRSAALEAGSGSIYSQDGSGVGLVVNGLLDLGLHF
jgi:hypothetical protein